MSTYTSKYFQNGEQLDQALMSATHAVSHAPQTLTDAQKAQARENIGTVSADDVDTAIKTALGDYSAALAMLDSVIGGVSE